MSQLYLTHIRIDICSERHSHVKSMKVNATWDNYILIIHKKTFKDLINIK